MTRTIAPRIALASVPVLVVAGLLSAPLAASAYGTGDLIAAGLEPRAVAFSPDGDTAWVTNQDSGTVSVIDVATGTETNEIAVGQEPALITVTPDGSEVWVAVWGSTSATDITIIDADTLSTTAIDSGGNGPFAIDFDDAGSFAYVTNYFTGILAKIDTSTRAVVDSATIGGFPEGVVLSADGLSLYVSQTNSDAVYRYSASTLDQLGSAIPVGDFPTELVLSPDGSEVWAVNNGSSSVSVISTATNSAVATVSTNVYPTGIAFDVDGFVWVSSFQDEVVQRIDPVTRQIVSTVPLVDHPRSIASHPTKRELYVTTLSNVATVELGTDRIAGADRYATAVEVSKAAFSSPVDTVYIATGLNYPDALAAGAVAAKSVSPILLTKPDTLPVVVANELVRLDPDNIVVLGGTGTITSAVQSQLAAYGTVTRIAGTNRYDTGRQLVSSGGFSNVDQVYIATGKNFPDALAAGAAAAASGSPVILVDGTASTLDAATLALIASTGTPKAVILGAANAVSSGIATQLDTEGYDVERLAGANRYETGVLVNQYAFGNAQTALLATGTNFPDALAGTTLASAASAPLYVVRTDCVPQDVLAEFDRLSTRDVILLGGTPTLTVAVEDLTACAS